MKGNRRFIFKKIKPYILSTKYSAIVLFFTSVLTIPVAMISPEIFQILIDDVMKQEDSAKFKTVVIGLLSVYLIRFILDGLNLYSSNKLLNNFSLSLRKDIFNKYLNLPIYKFDKHDPGDVKMRIIDDIDCLGNFINSQVVEYLYHIIMILLCLFLTLTISVSMTLICIITIPLVLVVNHLIGVGIKKVNEKTREVNE